MACFSNTAASMLKDAGQDDLRQSLDAAYSKVLDRRLDFVEYGDPEKLTDKRRTKLNCDLLKQVLLHRAERLMMASSEMLAGKNVYGLALNVRGHIEAVAVLGYFTRRLGSLAKGNIKFDRFELDIADGLMGAKHELFKEANAPVNILTCIEHADKHLDAEFFKEKKKILEDLYTWISEFAHPNFCSNKTAFTLDKETGRMILRNEDELRDDHIQMILTLDMSSKFLDWLVDDFSRRVTEAFPEEK